MRIPSPLLSKRDFGKGVASLVATVNAASAPAPVAARVAGREPHHRHFSTTPEGPLQIVVSIGSQRMFVYDKDRLAETLTVSTGTSDHPTPKGIFAIIDKEYEHRSNIYGGASMPFMQRLTLSGVALHSGNVTGRPASHGCIRLDHEFARRFFNVTKLGARVVVADGEPVPRPFQHASLPKPSWPAPKPVMQPAEGDDEPLSFDYEGSSGGPTSPTSRVKRGPATIEREAALAATGVSIFVSRADGRVYVRHAFKPLLDLPISVREPDRRIGTHIFTAANVNRDAMTADWLALSVATGSDGGQASRRRDRAAAVSLVHDISASGDTDAGEALSRVDLPAEVLEMVGPMLAAGASLIVADQGVSREMRSTGLTDFIVLLP